ncbi:hypothetical protein EVAR_11375_1 [Eumeta japonica]|uniref:Uncharacterized protein n=1 Tax=Eumeta variegata TaxID=151549 RepID=A0A4C1U0W5_EUMVA|nr:hypothetical protein EVAR_11375_1 [Eumeta japonica]
MIQLRDLHNKKGDSRWSFNYRGNYIRRPFAHRGRSTSRALCNICDVGPVTKPVGALRSSGDGGTYASTVDELEFYPRSGSTMHNL